jgi:hypothetical protein
MEEELPWSIHCGGLTDQFGRFGDGVEQQAIFAGLVCTETEVTSWTISVLKRDIVGLSVLGS